MRFDRDTILEITDALLRNKRRTVLTGFGVFWGLFMLLLMLGGGNGLKAMLYRNFDGFASNAAILAPGQTTKPWKGMSRGRSWSFTYTDVDRLKIMVPELDVVSPMVSSWGSNAVYGTGKISASVKGIRADYCKVEAPRLKYGRYINEVDVEKGRKVCVIGKRIYTTLFPEGGDPCGTYIKVGAVYYSVVGVDWSSGQISINGRADESIMIPITTAQKVYNRGNRVDIIMTTGKSGVKMSLLSKRIRQIIAREHLFDPSDEPAMMLLNTEQLFTLVDNLFLGLDILIIIVGLGTLLAGMVGVSNIMMVNVKSRTIEIGIRRAIGATPKDIVVQIMMESVLLTTVAGTLSILVSVLLLDLVEKITNENSFQISFWLGIGAIALIVVLGVLAGLAPASRAMQIKPVDAMRDE